MSKVLVTESSLSGIAAAIRTKNGTENTYKPGQMAAAIAAIETPDLEALTATQNGTYAPSAGKNGFSGAVVNVPNSYAAGDEGKVVSNGALIAQTARASEITANGTYDTTTNDEVTVNVSSGGSDLYPLWTDIYDNLPSGVSVSTPTITSHVLTPAWVASASQNVKDFINNSCRVSTRSSATGTTITANITSEMAQKNISQVTPDPNYFGGLIEYYGNLYGSTLLTTYNMVLLGDFSQGGSASNVLSDAVTNYSAIAVQGIYNKNRTSNYNTTMIYPTKLNIWRWTGMKDRNNIYNTTFNFTDAQTVRLEDKRQAIIYGIP